MKVLVFELAEERFAMKNDCVKDVFTVNQFFIAENLQEFYTIIDLRRLFNYSVVWHESVKAITTVFDSLFVVDEVLGILEADSIIPGQDKNDLIEGIIEIDGEIIYYLSADNITKNAVGWFRNFGFISLQNRF